MVTAGVLQDCLSFNVVLFPILLVANIFGRKSRSQSQALPPTAGDASIIQYPEWQSGHTTCFALVELRFSMGNHKVGQKNWKNIFEFLIIGNKASSVFRLFLPCSLFFTTAFLICSVELSDCLPRNKISLKNNIQETTTVNLLCVKLNTSTHYCQCLCPKTGKLNT